MGKYLKVTREISISETNDVARNAAAELRSKRMAVAVAYRALVGAGITSDGIIEIRDSIRRLKRRSRSGSGKGIAVKVIYRRGTLSIRKSFNADTLDPQGARRSTMELVRMVRAQVKSSRESMRTPETQSKYSNALSHYYELQAGVHVEPGFIVKAMKIRKNTRVFRDKEPVDDARHIGVELEFASDSDKQAIGTSLLDAGLDPYVTLKEDGSVRGGDAGANAHEICVIARETEISSIISRVCAVLNAHGAAVNDTCGMHVHLDMRSSSGRDRSKCFNNLVAAQTVLYRMVPKTRRENKYCKPTRGRDVEPHRRSNNRYKGINAASLRRHGTLEVRLHSGTTDASKVVNWITLLVAIADAPAIGRVSSHKTLARLASLTPDTVSYMESRLAEFADQHPSASRSRVSRAAVVTAVQDAVDEAIAA